MCAGSGSGRNSSFFFTQFSVSDFSLTIGPNARSSRWAQHLRATALAFLQPLQSVSTPVHVPGVRLRVWFLNRHGSFEDLDATGLAAQASFRDRRESTLVADNLEVASELVPHPCCRSFGGRSGRFQHYLHCTSYAARAGLGTSMHFGQGDVLFMQVKDRKAWMIAPNRRVSYLAEPYFGQSPSRSLLAHSRVSVSRCYVFAGAALLGKVVRRLFIWSVREAYV